MLPQEFIRKKRDGLLLKNDEIVEFVTGIVNGQVNEPQVASFCMAVFFQGMKNEECSALTLAMAHSGIVMDWSAENLSGPILDKHSTGGVGDKVSLILAPIIAACGGYVPMLSGRGLGHSGGTLDKMDSIEGYVSQPDIEKFKRVVRDVGCAIIGATADLAPADRVMYAVRDVTATVENIHLITASILSKKLAAGLDGLVMDVKYGTGAFMKEYDDAKRLAKSIVSVGKGAGLPITAVLTDMNQVLGHSAGNAVEVLEVVDFLTGKSRDKRLYDVTAVLAEEMLLLGGLANDKAQARQKIDEALDKGYAAEYFSKMIVALGGASDFVENPQKYMKSAPIIKEVFAEEEGFVQGLDVRNIGTGIVEMGGGRIKTSDKINHAVGITEMVQLGEEIDCKNKPIAIIHASDKVSAERMADRLKTSLKISDKKMNETTVVADIIR